MWMPPTHDRSEGRDVGQRSLDHDKQMERMYLIRIFESWTASDADAFAAALDEAGLWDLVWGIQTGALRSG